MCLDRLPRVGYCQFPDVSVCFPVIESKKDLSSCVSQAFLLGHFNTARTMPASAFKSGPA